MHDDTAPDSDRKTGLDRRTLVRAGATVAWTVPVVAMAAPASAATCSGGTTTLTAVQVGTTSYTGKTGTATVQVCNTGSSTTCDLSATADPAGTVDIKSFTVTGWGTATGGAGTQSLTVSAGTADQLAAGDCVNYTLTFTVATVGAVQVTFQTSNGGTAAVTV